MWGGEVPAEYGLAQNYPNPFNPATTIAYDLPKGSFVNLRVFNAIGQEVRTLVAGERSAGTHTIVWDASGLPSGVCFYRLSAGDFMATKTMILMK
ncbi:MAG: FlgD immunoglobulin-like domain containing protein [Bacteroidota bacterium]